MNNLPDGQRIVEDGADLGDRERCWHCRAQERDAASFRGHEHFHWRVPPACNHHAWDVMAEHSADDLEPGGGIEAFEIAHLALTENEDARGLEVLVEAGQGKAGLLNVRTRNRAADSRFPAEQLDREAKRLGPPLQEIRYGDGWSAHRIGCPTPSSHGHAALSFGLYQPQIPVGAAKEHGNRVGRWCCETRRTRRSCCRRPSRLHRSTSASPDIAGRG